MSVLWPQVKVGDETLTFVCNYKTLLLLETETSGNWQQALQDAIGVKSPKSIVDMAVRMTGETADRIEALSPPIVEVTDAISLAWDICMRGPVALRDDEAKKAADGEAAADEGKTLSTSSEADSVPPSAPESQNEASGS